MPGSRDPASTACAPTAVPEPAGLPDPRGNDLTSGGIARAVIRIALPTWGAFLTHDLLGVVDMFFVGKLGPSAVAAVSMSGVMFGIIIMLSQGVAAGTTALVASALGAGHRERAQSLAAQSLVLAGFLSLVVAACGIPLADALLRMLGASDEVVSLGGDYLRIVAGGAFTLMLTMALGSSLRAAGDAMVPFIAMVAANAVNIVLDPIFIFGWRGLPAMGVPGSAWATLIGRCVGLAILVSVFFGGRHRHFRLQLSHLKPELGTMRRIVGIGCFASGRMLIQNIAQLLLLRLVAAFGTIPLAAFGIGLRLQMFVFGPSMGFGTAAGAMVGQNLGAGLPERAERAGWVALRMAAVIAVVISTVYWFGGPWLVTLFSDDPDVIAGGATFLKWFGVSLVFLSAAFVLGQAMNGAGDTLAPMLIVAFALLLTGVPLAYGLARLWHSEQGVWAGMTASNALAGLASIALFKAGRWRHAAASRPLTQATPQDPLPVARPPR